MTVNCLSKTKDGVFLHVIASPRASRSEITGIYQNRCKIRVKAPPVDGEANKALITFLSKFFKLPKRQIVLQRGSTGKQKTFLLAGLSLETAKDTLEAFLNK